MFSRPRSGVASTDCDSRERVPSVYVSIARRILSQAHDSSCSAHFITCKVVTGASRDVVIQLHHLIDSVGLCFAKIYIKILLCDWSLVAPDRDVPYTHDDSDH